MIKYENIISSTFYNYLYTIFMKEREATLRFWNFGSFVLINRTKFKRNHLFVVICTLVPCLCYGKMCVVGRCVEWPTSSAADVGASQA